MTPECRTCGQRHVVNRLTLHPHETWPEPVRDFWLSFVTLLICGAAFVSLFAWAVTK